MNQLYVEANKSYKNGFILTEQELRRFNELIKDQLKKIEINSEISYNYKITFQNGVVAETEDINTVLAQENEGSKKIISLYILVKDKKENSITLSFYNVDSENVDSNNSVKFHIRSDDRDWVFVTSSLLEERIGKIKRFNFIYKNNTAFYRTLALFIPLILMLVTLIPLTNLFDKQNSYISDIR